MSDALQQAIVAIKTGNLALGRGLLEEILRIKKHSKQCLIG